jgi:hypothetical protein
VDDFNFESDEEETTDTEEKDCPESFADLQKRFYKTLNKASAAKKKEQRVIGETSSLKMKLQNKEEEQRLATEEANNLFEECDKILLQKMQPAYELMRTGGEAPAGTLAGAAAEEPAGSRGQGQQRESRSRGEGRDASGKEEG